MRNTQDCEGWPSVIVAVSKDPWSMTTMKMTVVFFIRHLALKNSFFGSANEKAMQIGRMMLLSFSHVDKNFW